MDKKRLSYIDDMIADITGLVLSHKDSCTVDSYTLKRICCEVRSRPAQQGSARISIVKLLQTKLGIERVQACTR